ncbi:hypothetical protein Tco_0652135 [Tanacetum coccineum]|uniref:Uncharacterized protein n=1 Tax=Tanacetum coccineum TaxID=301880 RepID=A0ABQ4WWP2_9ASTR
MECDGADGRKKQHPASPNKFSHVHLTNDDNHELKLPSKTSDYKCDPKISASVHSPSRQSLGIHSKYSDIVPTTGGTVSKFGTSMPTSTYVDIINPYATHSSWTMTQAVYSQREQPANNQSQINSTNTIPLQETNPVSACQRLFRKDTTKIGSRPILHPRLETMVNRCISLLSLLRNHFNSCDVLEELNTPENISNDVNLGQR